MSFGPEPYEDPALDPGFVRSTKEYLKQAHLYTIQNHLKKEGELALKRALDKKGGAESKYEQMSSTLSFLPANIPATTRNDKLS